MAIERLLCIIKPDAVKNGHADEICKRLQNNGLRIVLSKEEILDEKNIRRYTTSFSSASFYPLFLSHMTSGSSIILLLEGENAIEIFSKLKGATNPQLAQSGTLRRDFGTDMTKNAIHGSDSAESAANEINIFFPATEKRGTLYIISGPSGVGKTTLIKQVCDSIDQLEKIVPYTTRQRREDEIDGTHYHFIDDQAFTELLSKKEFLQHFQDLGCHYGMPLQPVLDKLKCGIDLIIDVDYLPARSVRKQIVDCKSIFILPESEDTLRERLTNRNEVNIEKRLARSSIVMPHYVEYDHLIFNDKLANALIELQAIIQSNRTTLLYQEYTHEKCFKKLGLEESAYSTILNTLESIPATRHFLENRGQIKIERLPGWNNNSYRVRYGKEEYFLRIPRAGKNIILNRVSEMNNLALVSCMNLYPQTIYYDTRSGVYLAPYIRTNGILANTDWMNNKFIESTMNILKKLHEAKPGFQNIVNPVDRASCLFKELQQSSFTGYKRIIMQLEKSRPVQINYDELVIHPGETCLTVYWWKDARVVEARLNKSDMPEIIENLEKSDFSQSHPDLINQITSRLGCKPFVDFKLFAETLTKIRDLHNLLLQLCPNLVSCHNDVSPYNFLHNPMEVILTDWENTGLNDPFYDLANFSIESGFDDEHDNMMLQHYLQRSPNPEDQIRLILYKPIVEYFLSTWLLYQIKNENKAVNQATFELTFNKRFEHCLQLMDSKEFKDAYTNAESLKNNRLAQHSLSSALTTIMSVGALAYSAYGLFARARSDTRSNKIKDARLQIDDQELPLRAKL